MSLWFHRRDKSGKKILWQIDFDFMIIMVVIGLLAALIGLGLIRNPSIIRMFPFMLLTAGLTCLIVSKTSLYKKGIWFSFGTGLMTKRYATLYKAAYVLLGAGVLLLFLLLDALRRS